MLNSVKSEKKTIPIKKFASRTVLEKEKGGLNQEYLALLNEIIQYIKELNNGEILYSAIGAMIHELPSSFSCLELALSIKKRYEKLQLLLCIFNKLSTKEKSLVRKEIYKEFPLVRSKSKKERLFYLIFDTEDKALVLFYKQEIENLEPKYLSTKLNFLISLSKFTGKREGYQLQSKALDYALSFNDESYYHLFRLLGKELQPSIKDKALSFLLDNWSKLDCHPDTRLHCASVLVEYCSTQAKPIIDELYQEAKKLNQISRNKTKVVDMLISLAGEANSLNLLFFSQEAMSVIKEMKDKDTIKLLVFFNLSAVLPQEMLEELYDLVTNHFAPHCPPDVVVDLLGDILDRLPKEQREDRIGELSFYLTKLGLIGKINRYLLRALNVLQYLPEQMQREAALNLLDLVVNNQDEKKQAISFGSLAPYLSQEAKATLLTLIDEMESATHKAAALANIITSFEGNEFISLAKKLLELVKISFENEQEGLFCSLIAAIGKKLSHSKGVICS